MKRCIRYLLAGLILASAGAALTAQTSMRGTYRVAIEAPRPGAATRGDERVWTYTVEDRAGAPVTVIRRAMTYDVAAPAPVVLESGRVILIHAFDGIAEIFGTDGGLERRVRLTDEAGPDHERVVRAAPHAREAVLAVSGAQGDGVSVFRLRDDGSIAGRRSIDAALVRGVAVADDVTLQAVSTVRWEAGRPVEETNVFRAASAWTVGAGFERAVFLGDSILAGLGARHAFAADVASRRLLWRSMPDSGTMYLDVAAGTGGVQLLVAEGPKWFEGGWIFTGPEVRTVGQDGRIASAIKLAQRSFSRGVFGLVGARVTVLLDGRIAQ